MQGLAGAGINDFCHVKPWTFVFAFWPWTEDIARAGGEGVGGELDKVVGSTGEIDTVEGILSSLTSRK
jgi:hypothetical protein